MILITFKKLKTWLPIVLLLQGVCYINYHLVRKMFSNDKSTIKRKTQNVCNGQTFHQRSYCNNNTLTGAYKNILTYALFGEGTRWNEGGLVYKENLAIILKELKSFPLYNSFAIRIYHDGGRAAQEIQYAFAKESRIELCNTPCLEVFRKNISRIMPMFFRFAPLIDPSIDIMCSRDLDSELTTREVAAVSKWINSSKPIHVMRDHPRHAPYLMLGGLWCFKNYMFREKGRQIWNKIHQLAVYDHGKDDQVVLNKVFWEQFSPTQDVLQHDSYNCLKYRGSVPFPTKRLDDVSFVGCNYTPCKGNLPPCPLECRPKQHQDWEFC